MLRHWRGEAPLAHYLATVFRNLQLDRLEALRPTDDPGDLPTDHPWDDPELAHTLMDIVSCLEKALGLLTPKQQRLIELRHQQGCRYGEIAAELGITTGTVGTNLADAERALRRRLSGECKELVEETVRTSRAGDPRETP